MSKIKIIGNSFMLIEHSTSGEIIVKLGEPNAGPTYEKYAIKIPTSEFQSMIELMQEAQRVFGLAPQHLSSTAIRGILDQQKYGGMTVSPSGAGPQQIPAGYYGNILDNGFTVGRKYGNE